MPVFQGLLDGSLKVIEMAVLLEWERPDVGRLVDAIEGHIQEHMHLGSVNAQATYKLYTTASAYALIEPRAA